MSALGQICDEPLPPNLAARTRARHVGQRGHGAAADLPLKAPALKSVYDWTGFYIGGHFGYGGGSLGPDTNPLPERRVLSASVTGLIGGYQIGYNRELANHVVLGVEADATFTSPLDQPRSRGCRQCRSTPRSTMSARCAAASATRSIA